MPTATSAKKDIVLRLAKSGPVRPRDLDDAGVPRAYLKRMLDEGLLEQIGRGLYRHR
jgi:hypothetical protein